MTETTSKVRKSEAEWQETLTSERYHVCRQGGTEPPESGRLLHEKRDGVFHCAADAAPLFESGTKFDSGSGWPSFFRPPEGRVSERRDTGHGMVRTEVLCARCESHLGHVFPDGPPPSGQRYCVNSLAWIFRRIAESA